MKAEPDLPAGVDRPSLIRFFHETMKPYEDRPNDIDRALDYAFSAEEGKGGFLVVGTRERTLVSALLMLNTGMGGYVPANLLLFVATSPELRGQGIGRKVCERALAECDGPVKLHVEYDNPAKRLYERLGFTTKYAEMRLAR
ncbi:MAG: GNAT family N-acetyltransferase [Candidatus Eisenbacteria bacterium]